MSCDLLNFIDLLVKPVQNKSHSVLHELGLHSSSLYPRSIETWVEDGMQNTYYHYIIMITGDSWCASRITTLDQSG